MEPTWLCILMSILSCPIFVICCSSFFVFVFVFFDFVRYLKVAEPAALAPAWSYLVNFRFSVLNQLDGTKFSRHVESKNFKHKVEDWGFPQFMKLTQLYEECAGYLDS